MINDGCGELNRKAKTITLKSKHVVPYDYLVFTPGLAFRATKLNPDFNEILGVFGANRFDRSAIISWIAKVKERPKILIYGIAIEAFSAIELLLKQNVSPSQIIFVYNSAKTHENAFAGNLDVEQIALQGVTDSGITVWSEMTIVEWSFDRFRAIESVSLIVRMPNFRSWTLPVLKRSALEP